MRRRGQTSLDLATAGERSDASRSLMQVVQISAAPWEKCRAFCG